MLSCASIKSISSCCSALSAPGVPHSVPSLSPLPSPSAVGRPWVSGSAVLAPATAASRDASGGADGNGSARPFSSVVFVAATAAEVDIAAVVSDDGGGGGDASAKPVSSVRAVAAAAVVVAAGVSDGVAGIGVAAAAWRSACTCATALPEMAWRL